MKSWYWLLKRISVMKVGIWCGDVFDGKKLADCVAGGRDMIRRDRGRSRVWRGMIYGQQPHGKEKLAKGSARQTDETSAPGAGAKDIGDSERGG